MSTCAATSTCAVSCISHPPLRPPNRLAASRQNTSSIRLYSPRNLPAFWLEKLMEALRAPWFSNGEEVQSSEEVSLRTGGDQKPSFVQGRTRTRRVSISLSSSPTRASPPPLLLFALPPSRFFSLPISWTMTRTPKPFQFLFFDPFDSGEIDGSGGEFS